MINKCLFPAAGLGTRFLPITKSIPKEMIPIVNKPLIEYGVDEAFQAGINHIAIVTSRNKYSIENYFDHNYELENRIKGTSKKMLLAELNEKLDKINFSYARQKEPKGLGHAILSGRHLIDKTEAFAVILADDLCINQHGDNVLAQMLAIHQQYPEHNIVALETVPKDKTDQYGIVQGNAISDNLIAITDMVEKPPLGTEQSNLAIIGRYILQNDIFENILKVEQANPENAEIQITDAIKLAIVDQKVLGYQFKGHRFDCGSKNGFLSAINYFADIMED